MMVESICGYIKLKTHQIKVLVQIIYKRELIIEKLETLISSYHQTKSPRGYSMNVPHYFEDYYTDKYGNGIKNCGDMLCYTKERNNSVR